MEICAAKISNRAGAGASTEARTRVSRAECDIVQAGWVRVCWVNHEGSVCVDLSCALVGDGDRERINVCPLRYQKTWPTRRKCHCCGACQACWTCLDGVGESRTAAVNHTGNGHRLVGRASGYNLVGHGRNRRVSAGCSNLEKLAYCKKEQTGSNIKRWLEARLHGVCVFTIYHLFLIIKL